MTSRGATPVGKQRVRTGCQTCRKRRRKCDEGKPRCEACEIKGFSCKYGPDLTFVRSSNPGRLQAGTEPNGNVQAYAAIKFVGDAANDAAPTSAESGLGASQHHSPARDVRSDSTATANAEFDRALSRGPSVGRNGNPAETSIARVDVGSYVVGNVSYRSAVPERTIHDKVLPASTNGIANTLATSFTSPRSRIFPGPPPSDQLTGKPAGTGSSHETGLLCHFRYNVAPWIDIGDPESSFGIKVMLAAKESRPLFAAILALAASQRSLMYSQQSTNEPESTLRYKQEVENRLRLADDRVSRVGSALLMLVDFFSSSPLQWRTLLLHQMDISAALPSLAAVEEDLNEPLFWIYFRIDLAASITSSQPPLLPFFSYLLDDGSSRNSLPSLTQPQSPKQVFQYSLILLASCLSLIFGNHEEPQPRIEYSDARTFAAMRGPSISSQWASLWTNCQRWYSNRPVEVQQILEIRGLEVDLIDEQNSSSFPFLVYTTPLALVANAVYHITSLLLLTHRPRIMKPLAGPRSLTSHIWHAQSIAGIAASNDSAEQWDPILVTGLLLAAKDMTHVSQQAAVLERLGRITALTGIKLDQEIEALKSTWDIAGYNEMEDN